MRRAARLLFRSLAFAALRASMVLSRVGRVLAVSTLTGKELEALSVAEWEAFGQNPPVADDQLFPWEEMLFATQVRPGDVILVVGAGAGRDVLPLLRAGHALTALDITPQALRSLAERARAEGLHVTTVLASAAEAALSPDAFDVVLFSWFSFGYIQGAAARQEALLRATRVLRAGGRILISYPRRSGRDYPRPSLTALGSGLARLVGGLVSEPGDEFVVTGSAIRPSVYFSHPFTPAEIEAEVRKAHLRILAHEEKIASVGILVLLKESAS